MIGALKNLRARIQRLDTSTFTDMPDRWFLEQLSVGESAWFLAHADDGVIWGRLQDGGLVFSSGLFDAISPPLRSSTLQQARLFGPQAEVRLWRSSAGFEARRIDEQPDNDAVAFDLEQILWGTRAADRQEGFTLVVEGGRGMAHSAPIQVPAHAFRQGTNRPLRLTVRHYLAYDETSGQAHVAISRLVRLWYWAEGDEDESAA